MKLFRIILILAAISVAGCAGRNSTTGNVSTALMLDSLAGVPGVGLIGAAASMVDLGATILSSSSSGTPEGGSSGGKQFVMSELLAKEFSDNGNILAFVLDSQERFKRGDWGEISPEQALINEAANGGKGSTGRYTLSGIPALIIVDSGEIYNSRFEDEAAEGSENPQESTKK